MSYGQEMSDGDYFRYFGEEEDDNHEELIDAIRQRIKNHIWIDKYGHTLKVEDMRTQHIWNCIKWLNSQKRETRRSVYIPINNLFTDASEEANLIEEYIAMFKQELKRRE